MTVYTLDFFYNAETIEFDETLLETFQKLLENNSESDIADLVKKTWEDRLKLTNNIDPSLDSGENIIPSSSENILSLFIGSRAARFFTKSKEIDKDKYGFEKRI